MLKEKRKICFIITISLAFALQMSIAYSYYDSLVEADFLCSELKYEAADLDFLAMNKQPKVPAGGAASVLPYSPDLISLEPSAPQFHMPNVDHTYSILRC